MPPAHTDAAATFLELEARYAAHNYKPLPVVLTRGQGAFVWDVQGKRYLDCLAAYSAVNQGHNHPRIVSALIEQAQRLALTSRAFHNDRFGPLCKKLADLLGYEKVLLMNAGAEAVETAIKAARRWGYQKKKVPADRAEIVVFDGNFHGRTTTIVGFSSEEQYRSGFGPFPPGFRRVPFGDAAAVQAAITPSTCAVLVEPIQGEAGIVVPPAGFLRELRAICDRDRVLLMADEIQSGLGRTGRMFCYEHDGVRPDVLILGKALSGGVYPVSAMLADAAVMDVFHPGDHGSTYGGNPLGAAVAVAALQVLVDEHMVDNAKTLGEHAFARLAGLRSPHVQQVRGKGLWIGIELKASAGGARRFCEALMQRGVLCKETHEHVIRLAPPLVITKLQLDEVLTAIESVLRTG